MGFQDTLSSALYTPDSAGRCSSRPQCWQRGGVTAATAEHSEFAGGAAGQGLWTQGLQKTGTPKNG